MQCEVNGNGCQLKMQSNFIDNDAFAGILSKFKGVVHPKKKTYPHVDPNQYGLQ